MSLHRRHFLGGLLATLAGMWSRPNTPAPPAAAPLSCAHPCHLPLPAPSGPPGGIVIHDRGYCPTCGQPVLRHGYLPPPRAIEVTVVTYQVDSSLSAGRQRRL